MEYEDDEEPPLAVEINDTVGRNQSQTSDDQRRKVVEGSPVGVTVITGYLGAGKSTVHSQSEYLQVFIKIFA